MTELNEARPSGDGEIRHYNSGDGSTSVAASNDIPAQVSAGPYPGDFNLNFMRNIDDKFKVEFLIKVRYKNGTICQEINSTNQILQNLEPSNQWLMYVQPARDRHEQNCEFYRHENGDISLKTLKKVESGEQLLAWHSEHLSRELNIPFLGLNNILGNQQYVCDKCGKTYTHPNPLKLHLRTHCDKSVVSKASSMPDRDVLFRPYLQCSCPSKPPVPEPGHTRQHPPHSLTRPLHYLTSPHRSSLYGQHPFSRAISPEDIHPVNLSLKDSFGKAKITTFHDNQFLQPLHLFNHVQPQVFPISVGNMTSPPYRCYDVWTPYTAGLSHHRNQNSTIWSGRQPCVRAQQLNNRQQGKFRSNPTPTKLPVPVSMPSESDGEPLDLLPKSFFANKSKKGHYCIYCGKLYSRKYGLKIHLRTHTGYKPLKCKVCLRPFGDPSNLNKHIRLHAQGETPYRCDYCGKVLVRRRDLERHIKSRHPNAAETGFVIQSECPTDIGMDSMLNKHDTDSDIVVV